MLFLGKMPFKYLLTFLYLLLVALMLTVVLLELKGEEPPFSLSHTSSEGSPDPSVLTVYGENLHRGLKGVLAKTLVNEQALVWRQLADSPARAVDVDGDFALVSCYGNKLVSMALQKGQKPKLLGSVDLPAAITQIKIAGDRALIGMQRDGGFSLVDIKDRSSLKLLSNHPVADFVADMVADRNVIYYTDLYQGIGRLDLSAARLNPEKLVALQSPWRIDLQGNKMLVGTLKGQVHLYEISPLGKLLEVGLFDYSPANVRGVVLTEEILAVALSDGTLRLFALSSWPTLSLLAQVNLPGNPMQLEHVPGSKNLVASLVAGGLALIDISQPEKPVVASHSLPTTFRQLDLQSDKVFAVDQEGLAAYDLDEIRGGEYAKASTNAVIGTDSHQLLSWNGRIYSYGDNGLDVLTKNTLQISPQTSHLVIMEEGRFLFFQLDEQGQTQQVNAQPPVAGAISAKFSGDLLYALHQDGLHIFSGSRPEELVPVSTLLLNGKFEGFEFLDHGYLLVVSRQAGILIVDVKDPQQPKLVANLIAPKHLRSVSVAQDVLIHGQRAYISHAAGGVHVVDVSSPTQPRLLQIIDTPGSAGDMVLHDDLLLVADSRQGIFILDVKDEDNALPVGNVLTSLSIVQMELAEEDLVIRNNHGVIMKLPLPERLQKVEVVSETKVRVDIGKVEEGQHVYLYGENAADEVRTVVSAKR